MSYDLSQHPYFVPWTDPESGVVSYLLARRVAPLQQSFYFVNASVSPDERWLWFYTAFPPNREKALAVVSLDPANPSIQRYAQAGFTGASPMVTPESDGVYFCMRNHVYRMGLDGGVSIACTLSEEYINHRNYNRLATHLTVSADGRYLLLDGDMGDFWWVGIGDLETGEVTVLKEFGSHHNHAQFSPIDPRLFVVPEDWWHDKVSGKRFSYDHRLWLMDVDQTRYEVVRPKAWDSGHNASASHEWWSRDGLICWNDYQSGTFECDPYTLEATHVWKRSLCHAHCSSDRRFWCADDSPYQWDRRPCAIRFYDRETGGEIDIVTAMPQPPMPRSSYHLDPHPQFSPGDSWVVYTTTVRGIVDVALAPVEGIRAQM
jgi:hypothetical protein